MSGHHQNLVFTFPETGSLQSIQTYPDDAIPVRRFGVNASVGTTYEVIEPSGLSVPIFPATAVNVEVLSTSANDTASGTGARKVLITGLDANFNRQVVEVTLNGITPVAVPVQFIRISAAEVTVVGTYGGSNLGTITIRQVGDGAFLTIEIGDGQALSSHFTIPAGYYAAITGADMSTDSGKTVDLRVMSRDRANDSVTPAPVSVAILFNGITGTNHFDWEPPIFIPPVTDVWITGKTASGTAAVSVSYWGWIRPI